MDEIKELGVTHVLSNVNVTRVEVDTDHYYFGEVDGQVKYYLSLTYVLDMGAPFPEGLRQYLRVTSFEEQKERLEMTGGRGTKLHDALDRLLQAEVLDMDDYKSTYEREAIATFVRCMRFLQPTKYETEQVVADPDLRIAGTMDLKATVDTWRLEALLDPKKYLELDSDGDFQLNERWVNMPKPGKTRVIIDWKFTGRNAYNHKVQVSAYKAMNNKTRRDEQPVSRAFTWRYSGKHKFGYDFQESHLSYQSFKRIYFTAMEYLGEFPEAPLIKVYPKQVKLLEEVSSWS